MSRESLSYWESTVVMFELVLMKFRKLKRLYQKNEKLDLHKTLIFSLFKSFPILLASSTGQKLLLHLHKLNLVHRATRLINTNYLKLCNILLQIWCSVLIHNLLHYMKFGKVSATPYYNYSLLCLCILLLDVFF